MLLAFTALLFKVNSILIVLVALALGAWLIRPAAGAGKMAGAGKPTTPKVEPVSAKRWAGIGAVVAVILAVVAFVVESQIRNRWAGIIPVQDRLGGVWQRHDDHPTDSV